MFRNERELRFLETLGKTPDQVHPFMAQIDVDPSCWFWHLLPDEIITNEVFGLHFDLDADGDDDDANAPQAKSLKALRLQVIKQHKRGLLSDHDMFQFSIILWMQKLRHAHDTDDVFRKVSKLLNMCLLDAHPDLPQNQPENNNNAIDGWRSWAHYLMPPMSSISVDILMEEDPEFDDDIVLADWIMEFLQLLYMEWDQWSAADQKVAPRKKRQRVGELTTTTTTGMSERAKLGFAYIITFIEYSIQEEVLSSWHDLANNVWTSELSTVFRQFEKVHHTAGIVLLALRFLRLRRSSVLLCTLDDIDFVHLATKMEALLFRRMEAATKVPQYAIRADFVKHMMFATKASNPPSISESDRFNPYLDQICKACAIILPINSIGKAIDNIRATLQAPSQNKRPQRATNNRKRLTAGDADDAEGDDGEQSPYSIQTVEKIPPELFEKYSGIIVHHALLVASHELDKAVMAAKRICELRIDVAVHERCWAHIWDILEYYGHIFVDGHDARDLAPMPYIKTKAKSKRKFMLDIMATNLGSYGFRFMEAYLTDVVRDVWENPNATEEEKNYVLLAAQKTALRMCCQCIKTTTVRGIMSYIDIDWKHTRREGPPQPPFKPASPYDIIDSQQEKVLDQWATAFLVYSNPIPPSLLDGDVLDIHRYIKHAEQPEELDEDVLATDVAQEQTEEADGPAAATVDDVLVQGSQAAHELEQEDEYIDDGEAQQHVAASDDDDDDDIVEVTEIIDSDDDMVVQGLPQEYIQQQAPAQMTYQYGDAVEGQYGYVDAAGQPMYAEEDGAYDSGAYDDDDGEEIEEDDAGAQFEDTDEMEMQDGMEALPPLRNRASVSAIDFSAEQADEAMEMAYEGQFPSSSKDDDDADDDDDDDVIEVVQTEPTKDVANDEEEEVTYDANTADSDQQQYKGEDEDEEEEEEEEQDDDDDEDDDDNGIDNNDNDDDVAVADDDVVADEMQPQQVYETDASVAIKTGVASEATDDEAEHNLMVEKAETDVADVGEDIEATTDEERDVDLRSTGISGAGSTVVGSDVENDHAPRQMGAASMDDDTMGAPDDDVKTDGADKGVMGSGANAAETGGDATGNGNQANRQAQLARDADRRKTSQYGYTSQLEDGYEPEDTHGYTEEEVSEAIHTEDEEEERRQKKARETMLNLDQQPADEDPVLPVEEAKIVQIRASDNLAHSSDDMDAADEHTEQEEDLGNESSELEEAPEQDPPMETENEGPESQAEAGSLVAFARRTQQQDESRVRENRRAREALEMDMEKAKTHEGADTKQDDPIVDAAARADRDISRDMHGAMSSNTETTFDQPTSLPAQQAAVSASNVEGGGAIAESPGASSVPASVVADDAAAAVLEADQPAHTLGAMDGAAEGLAVDVSASLPSHLQSSGREEVVDMPTTQILPEARVEGDSRGGPGSRPMVRSRSKQEGGTGDMLPPDSKEQESMVAGPVDGASEAYDEKGAGSETSAEDPVTETDQEPSIEIIGHGRGSREEEEASLHNLESMNSATEAHDESSAMDVEDNHTEGHTDADVDVEADIDEDGEANGGAEANADVVEDVEADVKADATVVADAAVELEAQQVHDSNEAMEGQDADVGGTGATVAVAIDVDDDASNGDDVEIADANNEIATEDAAEDVDVDVDAGNGDGDDMEVADAAESMEVDDDDDDATKSMTVEDAADADVDADIDVDVDVDVDTDPPVEGTDVAMQKEEQVELIDSEAQEDEVADAAAPSAPVVDNEDGEAKAEANTEGEARNEHHDHKDDDDNSSKNEDAAQDAEMTTTVDANADAQAETTKEAANNEASASPVIDADQGEDEPELSVPAVGKDATESTVPTASEVQQQDENAPIETAEAEADSPMQNEREIEQPDDTADAPDAAVLESAGQASDAPPDVADVEEAVAEEQVAEQEEAKIEATPPRESAKLEPEETLHQAVKLESDEAQDVDIPEASEVIEIDVSDEGAPEVEAEAEAEAEVETEAEAEAEPVPIPAVKESMETAEDQQPSNDEQPTEAQQQDDPKGQEGETDDKAAAEEPSPMVAESPARRKPRRRTRSKKSETPQEVVSEDDKSDISSVGSKSTVSGRRRSTRSRKPTTKAAALSAMARTPRRKKKRVEEMEAALPPVPEVNDDADAGKAVVDNADDDVSELHHDDHKEDHGNHDDDDDDATKADDEQGKEKDGSDIPVEITTVLQGEAATAAEKTEAGDAATQPQDDDKQADAEKGPEQDAANEKEAEEERPLTRRSARKKKPPTSTIPKTPTRRSRRQTARSRKSADEEASATKDDDTASVMSVSSRRSTRSSTRAAAKAIAAASEDEGAGKAEEAMAEVEENEPTAPTPRKRATTRKRATRTSEASAEPSVSSVTKRSRRKRKQISEEKSEVSKPPLPPKPSTRSTRGTRAKKADPDEQSVTSATSVRSTRSSSRRKAA